MRRIAKLVMSLALVVTACGAPDENTKRAATPETKGEDQPGNMAPSLASATLGAGPFDVDHELAVTLGKASDPEGDSIAYRYAWSVNGRAVSGAGAAALAPGKFQRGDRVLCTVTPSDGKLDGAPVSTAEVKIADAPPKVEPVSLPLTPVSADDPIQVTPIVSDGDGDAVTVTYQWYVGGAAVPGATAATMPTGTYHRGDSVTVRVTVSDGKQSTVVTSAPISIANADPVYSAVGFDAAAPSRATGVTATAAASDIDGDTLAYAYEWRVNGQIVAGETGATLNASRYQKGDSVTVTVTVSDGLGGTAAMTSSPIVIANTAPTLASASLGAGPYRTNDSITVIPGTSRDADSDTVTYTYRWTVDGAEVAGQTGATLAGSFFAKGQVVRAEVTPHDGEAAGTPVLSNAVTIQNTLPTLASADVGTGPYRTNDSITVTPGTSSDADSDTVTYTYRWTVDGTEVAGQTGATLAGSYFAKGQVVRAEVTPHDGEAAGTPVLSNAITIQNTLPTLASADVGAGPYRTNDSIAVTPGTSSDADSDTITYTYRWTVDGNEVAGQTGETLAGSFFAKGQVVRAEVTPHDGEAAGTPVLSNAVTVQNTLPTLASADVGSGPYHTSDAITVTPGSSSDADDDTVTYTYRWTVDGTEVAGHTGATLSGTFFAKGQVVRAEVTPHDGEAVGTPVLSNAVTIQNTLPTLASADVGAGPFRTNDSITVTPGSSNDADSDTVTYTYRWTVDGTEVAGQTGATLVGSFFAKGQVVRAEVTPHDGEAAGTPVLSNAVTIQNTLPTLASADVGAGPYRTNDSITVSPGTSGDADNDTVTYTYRWTVDGTEVAGQTGATLVGSFFAKGQVVRAEVTPHDGEAAGTPVLSNAVTIQNTLPTLASADVGAGPYRTNDSITVTPGTSSDADNDTVMYTYRWTVDGTEVAGQTGATLAGSYFAKGQVVRAEVTPHDGEGAGTPVVSNAVTIQNTLPTLASADVGAGPYRTNDLITVMPGTSSDADSDTVTYTYRWTVDGTDVAGQTGATLAGSFFAKGQVVRAEVTPHDGEAAGTPVLSNAVTIQNTPPTLASADVGAGPFYTDDTLTAVSGTSDDADSDSVALSYQWYVNGLPVPGATGSTLAGTQFDKNDAVFVLVLPDDGETSGLVVSSNTVTIANTPPTFAGLTFGAGPFTESSTLTAAATGWADADGDSEFYRYAWFVNGAPVAAATGASIDGVHFNHGDGVSVEVTAFDGTDTGTMRAASATIVNTPPVLSSASLGAGPYATDDAITLAAGAAADADGDEVTFSYRWFVDDVEVAGQTTPTLTGAYFTKGQAVYAEVMPHDGASAGTPVASNTVTIQNTAPGLLNVDLGSGPFDAASVLTADPFGATDADGDGVAFTYQWFVNGVAEPGAVGATFGGAFGRGDEVYVQVTPSDGEAEGAVVASAVVSIGNAAPGMTAASLGAGPYRKGDTITAYADATDADLDAVTFSIRWFVNGALVGTGHSLTGGFAKGDTVAAEITPNDGIVDGLRLWTAPITVLDTAPVVTSVDTGAGPFYKTSSISVAASAADADGDLVTLHYRWFVDGAPVAGDVPVLLLNSFAQGSTVAVEVRAEAGGTGSAPVWSSPITIWNRAPELTGVSLGAGPLYAGGTANSLVTSTDADGDTVIYRYRWFLNGSEVAGATGPTLSGIFSRNDSLTVEVTPNDGIADGAPVFSASVVVANSTPTQPGVAILPAPVTAATPKIWAKILTASTDPDGDAVAYAYAWYRNDVLQGYPATETLVTASDITAGDRWRVEVVAGDGLASSSKGTAATVVYFAAVTVVVGSNHTCALTSGGGVKCWGSNSNGQLGDGTQNNRTTPVDVVGLSSGVRAISASSQHTCAVLTTGTVKCWGNNALGQLGDNTWTSQLTPVGVSGLTDARYISGGNNHTCVVTNAGQVKCWGANNTGQIGNGTTTNQKAPVTLGLSNVTRIAAGGGHTCVLTNGAAYCWGANSYGQLGFGYTSSYAWTPGAVPSLTSGGQSITAGSAHTCAVITGGSVKCWGYNGSGQVGDGSWTDRYSPTQVSGLTNGFSGVTAAGGHTCALKSVEGTVKCWGSGTYGQLGNGTNSSQVLPVDVVGISSARWLSAGAGANYTCVVLASGGIKCWGFNLNGEAGSGFTWRQLTPYSVTGLSGGVAAVDAGDSHTCAVLADGRTTCWGYNYYGQVGNGSFLSSMTAVDVTGLGSGSQSVAASGHHTCALNETGGVKCWGANFYGALGIGTDVGTFSTPVDVNGLASGVQAIAVGLYRSCALTTAGGMKCWGYNGSGVLGVGDQLQRTTPVDVNGLTSGIQAMAVGDYHTCALTTGGGVKCWGGNGNGQVGDNSTTMRLTPVDVYGLTSVRAITLGQYHSCALTTAGGVKCWGYNSNGQLGIGNTTQQLVPVDVPTLTSGVKAIAAGYTHTCAALVAGGIKCWGANYNGQLGDGTTTQQTSPVSVGGTDDVLALTGGSNHTCAVLAGGALKCWGYGSYGQLGIYGTAGFAPTLSTVSFVP